MVFLEKAVLKICSKFTHAKVWFQAATQGSSYKKVLWKYAENLQANTYIKVRNYISEWVLSCKFAAYFHNTFY